MVNRNEKLSVHPPGPELVWGSSGALPLHPPHHQVDLADGWFHSLTLWVCYWGSVSDGFHLIEIPEKQESFSITALQSFILTGNKGFLSSKDILHDSDNECTKTNVEERNQWETHTRPQRNQLDTQNRPQRNQWDTLNWTPSSSAGKRAGKSTRKN